MWGVREIIGLLALALSAPTSPPVPATVDEAFACGVTAEQSIGHLPPGAERQAAIERALACYGRVLELVPHDPPTLSNRANVELAALQFTAAIADLRDAAAHDRPERGFYLRRLGDALGENGQTEASAQSYWQSVEWDPLQFAAHDKIVELLPRVPQGVRPADKGVQITDYLRHLLEWRLTERVVVTSAAVADLADARDTAAATAAALAQAAVALPPPELQTVAAPFIARGGEAGRELRAVINVERVDWAWLAAHGDAAATTDRPPHAAFRGLARAIGGAAASRGDLSLAERAYRLAIGMPGADLDDLVALIRFLGDYGSPASVRAAVEMQQPAHEQEPEFHRAASLAYALQWTCGDGRFGARYHLLRLADLHAQAPPLALEVCPLGGPVIFNGGATCPIDCSGTTSLGLSERDAHGCVLTIPLHADACAVDGALTMIASDYRPDAMLPLIIRTQLRNRKSAEEVRDKLLCRGIPADAVRVAESDVPSDRIRICFDRPSVP